METICVDLISVLGDSLTLSCNADSYSVDFLYRDAISSQFLLIPPSQPHTHTHTHTPTTYAHTEAIHTHKHTPHTRFFMNI